MKRALILVSGVGASLYPMLSCALGLGDLQVDSRLNQPLRAHIEISDVSEEEWRQIRARLAQQDDGALVRTVLDSLVFRTTEDANHRHLVEVSSKDPITEPLFDLSVEVAGQTVQVIRNYSVFLDPPGKDEVGSRGVSVAESGGTRAVESPGVAMGASARGAAPGARGGRVAARAAGEEANRQPGLQAGAAYTVVRSDTLERIVRRLGARTAAAKNRQMDWIFAHNPGAFYGSMDRLRAGARLTLPGQGAPAAAGSIAAAVTPAGEKAAAPDDRALQAQLEGQVSTLQQSLAKMQETIAAQDAEIADLNRKIAARAEQQRAERTTNALAARIAPEVASASDDVAEGAGAAASSSEAVGARSAPKAEESGSDAGRARASAARSSADDTTVPKRAPRWWAKRATYYWGGALGAAVILVAVLVTAVLVMAIRRRREAQVQYAPRYPLVEDSPFRYQATLETPPLVKQPASQPARAQAARRQPEPEVRKPDNGVHVEEESSESGLESWSTQTALLLSELPAADDTQPFMMAPHDDAETDFENERKSYASSREEQTAKLQAMETQGFDLQATGDLQTTGELMTPEELAEAELLGMEAPAGPEYGQKAENRSTRKGLGRDRQADDARTLEISSEEMLAAGALAVPANPEAARTVELDLARLREAQMSTTEIEAAELRRGRTAASKEVAEVLEASLSDEPDRVDIQLKLLEIYHHEALGNRDNFRSLLNKLAKDSRLLSPAQRQHVEALQRTLNEGKQQDADSSFVAEVAI